MCPSSKVLRAACKVCPLPCQLRCPPETTVQKLHCCSSSSVSLLSWKWKFLRDPNHSPWLQLLLLPTRRPSSSRSSRLCIWVNALARPVSVGFQLLGTYVAFWKPQARMGLGARGRGGLSEQTKRCQNFKNESKRMIMTGCQTNHFLLYRDLQFCTS